MTAVAQSDLLWTLHGKEEPQCVAESTHRCTHPTAHQAVYQPDIGALLYRINAQACDIITCTCKQLRLSVDEMLTKCCSSIHVDR